MKIKSQCTLNKLNQSEADFPQWGIPSIHKSLSCDLACSRELLRSLLVGFLETIIIMKAYFAAFVSC